MLAAPYRWFTLKAAFDLEDKTTFKTDPEGVHAAVGSVCLSSKSFT
jgi:hypothetical protein